MSRGVRSKRAVSHFPYRGQADRCSVPLSVGLFQEGYKYYTDVPSHSLRVKAVSLICGGNWF